MCFSSPGTTKLNEVLPHCKSTYLVLAQLAVA